MVWQLTKSALERWTTKLLHVHDTPERTAMAFGMGIAIGFSPFLGLHTAIGLTLAFFFNLNRVAVLIGLYLHLPWFMGPYYAGATALGAWITGARMPPDFLPKLDAIWQLHGWWVRFEALAHLLRPLLGAYVLGSSILAAILGTAAYHASLAFLRARRRLHPHHPEVR
jgi:uncharacterized protein (DUF2062 family)